jgi:hypothetical protein
MGISLADSKISTNHQERQEQRQALEKIFDLFWDKETAQEELNALEIGPYPELLEWRENLLKVCEERVAFETVLTKHKKASPKVILFFKLYYILPSTKAVSYLNHFKKVNANDRRETRFLLAIARDLSRKCPQLQSIRPLNLQMGKSKGSFRLAGKDSEVDKSGSSGCLIMFVIFVLLQIIKAIAK